MSLQLYQSDEFWADLARRVDWYRERTTPEVVEGFVNAVQATLDSLAETPALGRPRFTEWPELSGLYSFRVNRPFHRHLIFYRFDSERLLAERLIHGARDLPRRLLETPDEDRD